MNTDKLAEVLERIFWLLVLMAVGLAYYCWKSLEYQRWIH